jgi:hypothetical protein
MKTMLLYAASAAATVLLFSSGPTFAQADRTLGSSAYVQLASASSVTITLFSALPDAHADTEAAIFGKERDDDLLLLRKSVSASPAAIAALTAAGLTAADVVALKVLSGGAITLYVNDL